MAYTKILNSIGSGSWHTKQFKTLPQNVIEYFEVEGEDFKHDGQPQNPKMFTFQETPYIKQRTKQ